MRRASPPAWGRCCSRLRRTARLLGALVALEHLRHHAPPLGDALLAEREVDGRALLEAGELLDLLAGHVAHEALWDAAHAHPGGVGPGERRLLAGARLGVVGALVRLDGNREVLA